MDASPPPTPARPVRQRFYELDVVRVLTFACVIAVHVVSHTARGNVVLIGSLILLHFTREVFFALTGFVLTASWLARPQTLRRFWPRRFLLVGIPYLVWSLIYSGINWIDSPTDFWTFAGDYWHALYTGTAFYHMYFLLVTMQIYLVFPLLVRLVIATRRFHWLLLVIALGLQIADSALDQYKTGSLHYLNLFSNVLNYQGFVIAGMIAADHASTLLPWVRRSRPLIGIGCAVMGVLTIGAYVLQLALGKTPTLAATAYQPAVLVWSFAVCFGLLAVGTWWADRHPGSRHPGLSYASDRSFGVFLAHPLILWLVLLLAGGLLDALPPGIAALVAYPVVAGGALLIADLARRSPLSLPLAGRRWVARGRSMANSVPSEPVRTTDAVPR